MSDIQKRKLKLKDVDSFFTSDEVISATECTGLIQTPPISEEEAESYTQIYHVPKPENDENNGLQHE
ncbi:hypothetical protein [Caproiciproducens faecalis]|uniref:Uncharacterized protein n=1 Tax=Caproiciproducens faecalis TaxID=2820301 RepID=A0ABS7DQP9_9FIRM|nr:hypothetical protein [Caproiciproducens faecalis]MBW7573634.1 hypothetical protein [Caproiciproducens faecalis]